MHGTLILIDKLDAHVSVLKHTKTLDKLYTRTLYAIASTLISQQIWVMASATQRSQATLLINGAPRSELDWAMNNLEEMMRIATSQPCGFLTLDLQRRTPIGGFSRISIPTYKSLADLCDCVA